MVFAGRELVTTQSYAWSVLDGFAKDVLEKLKSNVYFHCRRCLEGNYDQSVLLKEVVNPI